MRPLTTEIAIEPVILLNLPLDTHIVAVHRRGSNIVCGGYTQLAWHDRVSVSGSDESLRKVQLQFEE